jgi:hypothetical protein
MSFLFIPFQVSKNTKHSSAKANSTRARPLLHSGLNGAYWNIQITPVSRQKRDISTSSSSSTLLSDLETVLYSKKTFITCRSPTDSFFLCQILQDVYNGTKQIPIRWCSVANETQIDENTRFKLDYKDTLDPNTILTKIPNVVHHPDKTISLKKQDIIKTNRLLKKAITNETGSNVTKRRRINSGEVARKLSF